MPAVMSNASSHDILDDIHLWICSNCNTYWHCNSCPFCDRSGRSDCRLLLSDDQTKQLIDAVSLINIDIDDEDLDDAQSYAESVESYREYQFYNDILPMLSWYVPNQLLTQACWFSLYLKKSVDPQIAIVMDLFKLEYKRVRRLNPSYEKYKKPIE